MIKYKYYNRDIPPRTVSEKDIEGEFQGIKKNYIRVFSVPSSGASALTARDKSPYEYCKRKKLNKEPGCNVWTINRLNQKIPPCIFYGECDLNKQGE